MGQLIRLPVSKTPGGSSPRITSYSPARHLPEPAKILMFTGVRYERCGTAPSGRLPTTKPAQEAGRS